MKKDPPSKITPEQSKDAGLALLLILLILYGSTKTPIFLLLAIICLIVDMVIPLVFMPFAWLWFGLAALIGGITNKLFLSVVYFIILFPMALVRRKMGIDSLQLTKFKKGSGSVFINKDKTFQRDDLINPF